MSAKASKRAAAPRRRKPAAAARQPQSILIRGAHVLTVDANDTTGRLDVRIDGDRIGAIGEKLSARGVERVIEAGDLVLMPGLVQAHIHLCQTLFRSQADDMELLTWLRERIWPMEGALEADDLRAAARLGLSEILLGGTTSVLDMGTVRHGDVLFEEAERFGIRYTGGKCLMDQGHGFPGGLRETTEEAISESVRLCERWHGAASGRLRYAFSPRFVLSCSEAAMRASVEEARKRGALLHTHASENSEEVDLVRERTGMGNVEYLHSIGFSGADVLLAHGIWLSAVERKILRETRTRIVHCPSANLKLASGIARIDELLANDVHVAIGADGAACNNGLDAFGEMRLTALLHKVRGGPTAVPAAQALRLATRSGALALGLEDTGSIEVGHKADVVLLDLNEPHVFPALGDLASRVVYAARSSDVHTVIVDGRVVVEERRVLAAPTDEVLAEAQAAAQRVQQRIA